MDPILIIEDDERLLYALSQAMRGAGYNVLTAPSAEDAILMFEGDGARTPSAIVLDLGLPGMGGGHFMSWVKHQPKLARVPFIVVTGAADVTSKLDVLPERILSKPVSPEDLALALQRVLKKS